MDAETEKALNKLKGRVSELEKKPGGTDHRLGRIEQRIQDLYERTQGLLTKLVVATEWRNYGEEFPKEYRPAMADLMLEMLTYSDQWWADRAQKSVRGWVRLMLSMLKERQGG